MTNSRYVGIALIVLILLSITVSSAYVVRETEQVIVTQFGKPVGGPVFDPGIHFKIPIVQKANFFDKRFLEWDGDPNQIPTKDKRFIWVDTYARWRINDPLLFFQRLTNERNALSRLDDILDGETRNAIAKHLLVEVVRTTNRIVQASEDASDETVQTLAHINFGREKITRSIIEAASERVQELGIELLDLRLKRINYVEDVQKKIFERMITERKRKADKFRSEGQGEASKILGNMDRDLKKIQSEAYKTAQEIIGKSDAEAAEIYASVYNQSSDSRDFYSFIKTMETYKTTFSDKDWLILSTKSDFYKYIQKGSVK